MCQSAPDYTPLASASKESAKIMAKLGRNQLRFSRNQYKQMRPAIKKIAYAQTRGMQDANKQAREYYNYNKNAFRPLERQVVREAKNFDERAQRDQFAKKAAADVGRAGRIERQADNRDMARMGVNPNSARFRAQKDARGLQLAGMRAGAMTGARERAEQTGYARKMDAVGLGRGLPAASAGAYGVMINAGNSAAANMQAPGQAHMNNMATAAQTIGAGQQMNINGLSNIVSAQASEGNPFIDILGIAGQAYGASKYGASGGKI